MPCLLASALQHVGGNVDTIAGLLLIDFYVVRFYDRRHSYLIGVPGLNGNVARLRINGNIRMSADGKTVFLSGLSLALGEGGRGQAHRENESRKSAEIDVGRKNRDLLETPNTFHNNAPAAGQAALPLLNTV
jgi:hypothetical protein